MLRLYNHHDPDCPKFLETGLDAIQAEHFRDIFCDCRRYAEPHVMRAEHDLCRPQ